MFKPRVFQDEDIPWFLNHPKSGIWYEPRLGKTVVSLWVNALAGHPTILIICKKNGLRVWRTHTQKLFEQLVPNKTVKITVINRKYTSSDSRKALWLSARDADVNVFIVTWGSLLRDYSWLVMKGLTFKSIIADEYHTFLKNRKNASVKMLDILTRFADRYHPLSGTPTNDGPGNYFPVLRQFNPKFFSSYWKYVGAFYHVIEGPWGKELGQLKNITEFNATLARYGRVRTRLQCAPWMPKVENSTRPVEMTPEQRDLYTALDKDKFAFTANGDIIVTANSMETALRKRQILVCPKILNPELGVGAALEDVIEFLEDAETPEERHIVIFTPFKQALSHFKDALAKAGYHHVYQLYGGIDEEKQEEQIQGFLKNQGIMLCTTQYAQAFSLAPARECFHIGYSWDPNENIQATDRLVPQEGTNPIQAWFYGYQDTDDAIMSELVGVKHKRILASMRPTQSPPTTEGA